MKKLLAGAAVALALSAGGAAQASTVILNLNVDSCTGTCGNFGGSYGTVTVTGVGSSTLGFTVALDPTKNFFFNQAGHPTELFSLAGDPTIGINSVSPSTFSAPATETAGAISGGGSFGDFDYHIDWVGPPTNNGNLPGGGIKTLTFNVTGTGPLTLTDGEIVHRNGTTHTGIYFVADIFGSNGLTGRVGATLGGGVPEPATWAMMLTGFFGMGAVLRRRRAAAAVA